MGRRERLRLYRWVSIIIILSIVGKERVIGDRVSR